MVKKNTVPLKNVDSFWKIYDQLSLEQKFLLLEYLKIKDAIDILTKEKHPVKLYRVISRKTQRFELPWRMRRDIKDVINVVDCTTGKKHPVTKSMSDAYNDIMNVIIEMGNSFLLNGEIPSVSPQISAATSTFNSIIESTQESTTDSLGLKDPVAGNETIEGKFIWDNLP